MVCVICSLGAFQAPTQYKSLQQPLFFFLSHRRSLDHRTSPQLKAYSSPTTIHTVTIMFSKSFLLALLPSLSLSIPTPDTGTELIPQSQQPCNSSHPNYVLFNINAYSYYTFQSPSAAGAKLGYISFGFANDAVDYLAFCEGVSILPFGELRHDQIFDCINYYLNGSSAEGGKTSFSFSSPEKSLVINNTWSCDSEDGQVLKFSCRNYGNERLI